MTSVQPMTILWLIDAEIPTFVHAAAREHGARTLRRQVSEVRGALFGARAIDRGAVLAVVPDEVTARIDRPKGSWPREASKASARPLDVARLAVRRSAINQSRLSIR